MIVSALVLMLVTQAAVVAAALAPPALGPAVTSALGLAPETIGYFASAVFAAALAGAQAAPALVARLGPVRASQATTLAAAAGLGLAASGSAAGLAAGAVLLGLAYAPGNPASSALLSAVAPPRLWGRVFSLKQTAVPLGGAIAGSAGPLLAGALGWRGALAGLAGLCLAATLAAEPWRRRLDAAVPAATARRGAPLAIVAATPALRRIAAAAGGLAGAQFAMAAVLVTVLVEGAGVDAGAAGATLSAAMLASLALRIGFGWLADRVGGLRVLAGVAVGAATVSAFAGLGGLSLGPGAAMAALGALGAIVYSWNGVMLAEAAAAAPREAVAGATAGVMSFVFLGGFAGPAAFALAASLGGFAAGFAATGVFALAALLALAGARRRLAAG